MQKAFGLQSMQVRNVSFDAIVAGTVTNYDIALSQISITPERAKVVDFSIEYFESQQGVLMKTGKSISTLAEAKKLNWGVQTATTAITLLKSFGAKTPKTYPDLANAYTALEAGQVDAVLIDTAINLGQAARSNGKLHVVAQFDQPGRSRQVRRDPPEGIAERRCGQRGVQEPEGLGRVGQARHQGSDRRPRNDPQDPHHQGACLLSDRRTLRFRRTARRPTPGGVAFKPAPRAH